MVAVHEELGLGLGWADERAGDEVSPEERHEMVAVAAYFCAERRGFLPGHEREDWLEAAAVIDAMIENMRRAGVTRCDYERVGLRNALRLWTG